MKNIKAFLGLVVLFLASIYLPAYAHYKLYDHSCGEGFQAWYYPPTMVISCLVPLVIFIIMCAEFADVTVGEVK